jgi:hypothetical protein
MWQCHACTIGGRAQAMGPAPRGYGKKCRRPYFEHHDVGRLAPGAVLGKRTESTSRHLHKHLVVSNLARLMQALITVEARLSCFHVTFSSGVQSLVVSVAHFVLHYL